ncbi:SH3 domain-containing protein [Streptomyces sp. NPDC087218]|uniref:SH3 domain-containing protein n=1 Tax=Streptomyces sp. NPDC087218 TaxID=3365769 RepID=UPI003830B3A3
MRKRTAVLSAFGAAVVALSVSTSAQAATWTPTEATQYANIRECYRASCAPTGVIFPEMPVWWSHYAYNSVGNKWYYVRNDNGNTGWVYCGNLTAGC